eukprot:gene15614-17189_t
MAQLRFVRPTNATPVREGCRKTPCLRSNSNGEAIFSAEHLAIASVNETLKEGNNTKNNNHQAAGEEGEGIKVFKVDFGRVNILYTVCLLILLASLAKIAFHLSKRLSSFVPESCLLILLGIPVGLILRAAGLQKLTLYFSSTLFFFCLLPPIILDAGYFISIRAFYSNIGTILIYATLKSKAPKDNNTKEERNISKTLNTNTGLSLYGLGSIVSIKYSLTHALLFGSLISAVDPVAVLAVFEEVQVHEILYILVFGESVLNDAASVVLYHTFEAMSKMSVVNIKQVALAVVSFFVVSLGGTLIGIIWGLATSLITRFTKHVRVIEPIFIFLMSYMAYLTAEIFHFSGIMAIFFCAIIMKPYVESNISRKSHTTIKYFMKLLSTCCETIIFLFLGASLTMDQHRWNSSFVFLTLLFITLYRAIGVVCLTTIANRIGRLTKIGITEQFIMSYGGLRGAVAFCLAVLLDAKHMSRELRETMITTSMVVVIFTVFVQGTTIKPLVKLLKVRRKETRDFTMTAVINDRIIDHLVAGVEEISGHRGHGYWRAQIDYCNKKYLRKCLERNPDEALDEEIMIANRKMAFKAALEMANHPTAHMDRTGTTGIKQNSSYAIAIALRDNNDDDQPHLDTGVLKAQNFDDEEVIKHNVSFLIPKPRATKLKSRAMSGRKYSLASVDEPDDEIPHRNNKFKRAALAHMAISKMSDQSRHDKKHRHHHRHRRNRNHEAEEHPLTCKSSGDGDYPAEKSARGEDGGDEDEGISFKADHRMDVHEMKEFEESIPLVPYTVPMCQSEPERDPHNDRSVSDCAELIENAPLLGIATAESDDPVTVHSAHSSKKSLECHDN